MVSILVLLFCLLTTWTIVSAVIVAVIVLAVQVMEPSGPFSRVQLDGQPVVPAALGNVILVEFANVAVFISPCLWYQDVFSQLTGIWDCSRYTERYGKHEITSKSKRKQVGQHGECRLAVTTVGALHTSTRRKQRATRLGLSESGYLMSTLWTDVQTRIIRLRILVCTIVCILEALGDGATEEGAC